MDQTDYSYSSSHSYRELAQAASRELDTHIRQSIESLLAADAAKHDKLVGLISGLRKAQVVLDDLSRKWSEDDDEQPSLKLVRVEW